MAISAEMKNFIQFLRPDLTTDEEIQSVIRWYRPTSSLSSIEFPPPRDTNINPGTAVIHKVMKVGGIGTVVVGIAVGPFRLRYEHKQKMNTDREVVVNNAMDDGTWRSCSESFDVESGYSGEFCWHLKNVATRDIKEGDYFVSS
jgi:translation elongation factor EF-1alpha